MSDNNCDRENCQKEMLEKLKDTLKNELNIDDKKFQNKLLDIIRVNLKSEICKDINKIKSNIEYSNLYDLLNNILVIIFTIIFIFYWLMGLVIAKGFWNTLFAIIPFYSWYLVVEYYLIKFGIL